MIIDEILGELAIGKAADLLLGASGGVIKKVKQTKDWKKVFVGLDREFIAQHKNADAVFEDISEVLSQKNMVELSKNIESESGYELRNEILSFLVERMEKYEIPHNEALLYANDILYVIVEHIKAVAPEKYDRFFQQSWKEEQTKELKAISDKITKVEQEIALYRGQQIQIFSADEIDLQLKRATDTPRIGISFFEIDDEKFCELFDEVRYEEKIFIRSRCQEEAIYCIINQLWKCNDTRAIFVVKSAEDWTRIQKISEGGNIYIPYFYADEIPAIPGNTNIFIFPEHIPTFSQNTITLRKRTMQTIANCLQRAGLEINAANALVSDTHGLYIPMKRKLFNGAFLKVPAWVSSLPDSIKKVALLLGQWTDADGDHLLIETLSGLSYQEFIRQIIQDSKSEEPLVCISNRHGETAYYLSSVENTWEYLSVTTDDPIWQQFVKWFIDVMNEDEELFTYTSQERLLAQIRGEKLFWSGTVRKGMLRTLTMKAFYRGDEDCQREMDDLVTQVLDYVQSENQWRYISRYFLDLCEISPNAVISRLKSEFNRQTGLTALFQKQTSDFLFERNEYTDILFGIEEFLLQKEYYHEGINLLFLIDSQNYDFKSNAPKDIFHKVFCPFRNFSVLQSLDEKVHFAHIAFEKTTHAWEYLSNEMPGSDSMILGELHAPKYRPYVLNENVTTGEYAETVNSYLQLLLQHTQFNPDRWIKLLIKSEALNDEQRTQIFSQLLYDVQQMEDEEIIQIKNKIRDVIHRHRYFSSASWAMPEKVLIQYEGLLSRLHTIKPEFEFEYLFCSEHQIPMLYPKSYKEGNAREWNAEKEQQLISDRILAFKENGYDLAALVEICSKSETSGLGRYLAVYWDDRKFNAEVYRLLMAHQASGQMAVDYYSTLAPNGDVIFREILSISVQAGGTAEMIAQLYGIEARFCTDIPAIASAQDEIKHIFWEKEWLDYGNNLEWALQECQQYGSMSSFAGLLYYAYYEHKIEIAMLYDYFITLNKLKADLTNSLGYYLAEILKPLHKEYINDAERCMHIAEMEIYFHPLLEWSDMKCCNAVMAQSPEIYADVVSIIYPRDGGEMQLHQSDSEKQRINSVCHFFKKVKFCPGEQNGIIREDVLIAWVEKFRDLLRQNNQSSRFGSLLGEVFANSPVGEDGCFPSEPVRRMIERYADDSLISEYRIAILNKRGVFSPSAGKAEQTLSEKYLANAEALALQYPKTAKIYYGLARRYESYAKQERENAENGWF